MRPLLARVLEAQALAVPEVVGAAEVAVEAEAVEAVEAAAVESQPHQRLINFEAVEGRMYRRRLVILLSGSMLALSAVVLTAHAQMPAQPPARQQVHGSQLMTPQERTEFRARMWAARSPQEREQIRAEHHARMQARAWERGVTLPDGPPGYGYGGGMGPGMGPGMGGTGPRGMGPGGGMGGMGGPPR